MGYIGAMGYRLPDAVKRKQELDSELHRIVDILKTQGAEQVILFGSLARGDIGSHSDIDLIVVQETGERFLDRLDAIYRAVIPKVALDVLVYTPAEFEALRRDNSFVRGAVAEGRVLYAKESR